MASQKSNGDLILLGLQYYGTAAVPGGIHNPLIVGFSQKSGNDWVKDDETPWCSAFLNAIARQIGAPSSGSLAAQSWLKIGTKVPSPQFGDVVIFERGAKNSGLGHVGFVVAAYPGRLYVLGGNQNNEVNISQFPTDRVLGYRRLFA